jgi:4-aminobutyrate aminotransferase-like enzyme
MARPHNLGRGGDVGFTVTRAAGSYLFDARRRYIDFVSGWCVGNLGWNHPVVVDALRRFRGPDYVYPEHGYTPWDELARRLAAAVPERLVTSFRATGGSEAIELALQAAMLHTRRGRFLSLEDAYHGNTIGALSIGSADSRKVYPNLLRSCDTITLPLDDRALDRIETRLKRRDVAAFVMEPVGINLGVLVPRASFMTSLQRLCRRYGTLLVMDEVACGFGRTGALFATEHYGIAPDMLCIGKAMTAGVLGAGAMIATAPVARSMEKRGAFWSTYGWHPRSVAAAIATLRYMTANRRRLMSGVERMSAYFFARLASSRLSQFGAINVSGLAVSIDVEDESRADQIQRRSLRRGLILSTQGSKLLLLPSLTIGEGVAAEGLNILDECVPRARV